MAWLQRLDTGEMQMISHSRIVVPLADGAEGERRMRQYGTFSTMNRCWNQRRSEETIGIYWTTLRSGHTIIRCIESNAVGGPLFPTKR